MQSYPNPQPSQVGAAPHRHPAHTGMAGLGVARPAVGAAVPPNAAQDMPTYSAQSLGQQQFYRDPQAPHQTAAPPGRYAPPATQPPAAQPPTTAQSGAGTVCPPTGYDTRPTTNYSPAATTQYQTGATGGYGPQAHSYPTMDPAGRTASQTRSGFQGSQRMAPPYAKLCAREPPKRSINLTDAPSPVSRIPFTNPPATVSTHQTDAPPLSTVGFISQDTGCCSPKFFRPTFGLAPVEARLVTDSCISFGAVLQPLCRPLYPQEEVPLITSRSPIRCHRCSGYLSCHAHFTEQGRCWLCPLCEVSNEVPQEYFCNLDSRGRRLDRMDKAELHLGAVEFDVEDQPDYLQRNDKSIAVPSQPLHTLFLIDISRHARVNFLTDYVAAMRLSIQAMAALPEAAGTRVGFITYATRLHFYNFRDPRRPQVSMADVDHPFVPLPFSAMCWLDVVEEYDLIDAFLCDVERLSADAEETDCAVGAAIEAAMIVLAGLNGGRVVVSAHRSPQTGIGAIKLREQHKTYGTDKGADLLRPMDGFWTTTATKAAQHSISFDLFMVCSEYCELATMSNLCHVTNGQCFLLSNYTTNRDAELLQSLMCARLTDETGYAGILRVRCSTGLRVARYRGHFYSQTATDMDLATVTGASTFFVDFAHEDKLDVNKYAFFQVALLYTTRAGRRRVRLLSYRLRCTRTLTEAYTASDLEATTVACIHDAMADTVNKGPHAASTAALKRMVKHLVNYRIFCIGKGSAQRHVLMPKHLQLLPLFIGCLCRSQAMVDGTVVRVDERAQSIFDWIRVPPHRALTRLHPMLYDLQNLLSDSKLGEIHDLTGKCVLPTPVRLLYDYVRSDGAYVLVDEETRTVFMWIGAVVPPNISTQLFGGPDATTVCRADGLQFDDFNPRVKNLLYAVVSQDEVKFRFAVIHQGDRREEDFFALLKCEAYGTMMGYGELLEKLYTQINNQIAESGYGY